MAPRSHAARIQKLADAQQERQREAPDVLQRAFPEQLAYILDTAPLKSLFCTRRAAKSFSIGLEHIDSMIRYGGKHLYIGLTRETARAIMWVDVIKAIDEQFGCRLKYNETRLEAVYPPTGGSIQLLGMDSNEKEKKKALGQKYRKVAVDEAQDFQIDLRQLIYAVLKPAVADYSGSIAIAGTPSNVLRGLFRDLTDPAAKKDPTEPYWEPHGWTTERNPYMASQWEREIREMRERNPLTLETSWFRQMYRREWVNDGRFTVYDYSSARNDWDGILPFHPVGRWHYVLSVDIGYEDATAFTVGCYHDNNPALHVLESWAERGMDITAVVTKTNIYRARFDFDALVIDGANKQAVEEMRRRHEIPFIAADKRGKADFIELMNADLVQGNIKVGPEAALLVDEWSKLVWDEKMMKLGRREEKQSLANDRSDSCLYLWRFCYQYTSRLLPSRAQTGTPEWYAKIQAELEQAAEQRLLDSKNEENTDEWRWPSE